VTWILPPSITSAYALDTEESISDSPESWATECERSLLARSKPSPARTWLQRWKRDSWTRHLSGLISRPSLGESFTDWWTSSLAATRVSRSLPQASEPERTTLATCGLGSQMELPFFGLDSASSRTSKDTLPLGSVTLLRTWAEWVTERRGAYSRRLKSALLTSGSGSSSWPTVTVAEAGKISCQPNYGQLGLSNHPEVHGREVERPKGEKSRAGWPTPTATECQDQGTNWEALAKADKGGRILRRIATLSLGHPAPANPSTDGSRRESWITPQCQDSKHSGTNLSPNGERDLLVNQVGKTWRTPSASDGEGGVMEMRPDAAGKYKLRDHVAHEAKTWPTASSAGVTGGPTGLAGGSGNRAKLAAMLPEAEAKAMGSGKLNSRWVETLMGLPIGWTMPSCTSPATIVPTNCDCLETESSPQPQSKRSGS